MKYFIIEESIDLDIIGEYPQVSPTENYWAIHSPIKDFLLERFLIKIRV